MKKERSTVLLAKKSVSSELLRQTDDKSPVVAHLQGKNTNKSYNCDSKRANFSHYLCVNITIETYRLVVELTLVLLRDLREMMESPQLTTVPLLMENVRRRYRSSLCRGLYGFSGSEQTRGRMWSGTGKKRERERNKTCESAIQQKNFYGPSFT